jgi:hypothetical protein
VLAGAAAAVSGWLDNVAPGSGGGGPNVAATGVPGSGGNGGDYGGGGGGGCGFLNQALTPVRVRITNQGSGYTTATATFSNDTTGTCTVSGGRVTAVSVDTAGTPIASGGAVPTCTISGDGAGATCTVMMNGAGGDGGASVVVVTTQF